MKSHHFESLFNNSNSPHSKRIQYTSPTRHEISTAMAQAICPLNSDAIYDIFVSVWYLLFIALLLPMVLGLIIGTSVPILFAISLGLTEFH